MGMYGSGVKIGMKIIQREWEKIRRGQQRGERRMLLGGSFLNVGLEARSSSRFGNSPGARDAIPMGMFPNLVSR